LELFNRQFYNTEEQGVFRKLSKKEMAEYTSPLNYITMVEALKNGSHTTTLQRICKNSSLKQLPRCEYQYALTKGLSKFYQQVQAEELAQHMRRVIWHSGDLQQDPDVSILGTNQRNASPSPLHGTYQDNAIVRADTLEELQSCPRRWRR
jgi:hypothetical protein